jgi:hypothetical protein
MRPLSSLCLTAALALSASAASAQSFARVELHPELTSAYRPSVQPDTPAEPTPSDPAATSIYAAAYKTEVAPANYRPFRAYAIGFRIGLGGIGGEIATPLGSHLRIRAGAQAFSYTTDVTTDGIVAVGTLKLGDTFANLDYHPFRNGFHLSPGVTLRNSNSVTATVNIPGGNTFTLNDVQYTSQPGNPVQGNASVVFGKKVAPRLTIGIGNMFPNSGGHWSFPVEIGAEYTQRPVVAIALTGSACTSQGCGSIDTPANLANIAGEVTKIQNDLAPARFFPILSFGIAFRIGH